MKKVIIAVLMIFSITVNAHDGYTSYRKTDSLELTDLNGQNIVILITNINYIREGTKNHCTGSTMIQFDGLLGLLCVRESVDEVLIRMNLPKR